jgi:diaminopimelate decarboxylase
MTENQSRSQIQADPFDIARAHALQATLGNAPSLQTGDPLPPFAHQIYFWDPQPPANLGRDGHQSTGNFIPDLGLPKRMWAAGRLTFHRALLAGIPAEKIMFSGVGKKAHEMDYALSEGILCFNVESEPELEMLAARAQAMGKVANVSFRINPDVDAKTHAKISTGKAADKFGIPWKDAPRIYKKAAELDGIKVTGIDMHIGSQIIDLEPFDTAFARLAELIGELRSQGHDIEHVDVGGGLGIPYHEDNQPPPNPDDYAAVVKKHVRDLDAKVIFEPGRLIAGNAGIFVTEVIYIKEGADRVFVIVDGAMNDLIRPTLYDAYHEVRPVNVARASSARVTADVVGPVCESGDYLAKGREMSMPRQGDLLALGSAGAYGAVQAGTYNSRLLVPEVLVNGSEWHVVRPRTSYEEMIALDSMPDWIDV